MNETETKNIDSDAIITSYQSKNSAVRILRKKQQDKAWSHLSSLTIQGESITIVSSAIEKKELELWTSIITKSADIIAKFIHKALLQVLPTAANLHRWKKISDPYCTLCRQNLMQTNKHVLSNCPSQVALLRYTARHNSVLYLVAKWLFQNVRPDITILNESSVVTLELTICHESNLIKSN